MARHDKWLQAAMDWQSHLASVKAAQCPVVTFDNVPREVLIQMFQKQIDDARETLDKPK